MTGDLNGHIRPLVHLGKDQFILGYERDRSGSSPTTLTISLPSETTEHAAWLRYLLRRLHEVDPVKFPGDPDWTSGREWADPETLAKLERIEELTDARDEAVREFNRGIVSAEADLESARRQSAVGPQRLLTEDGDALVEAVEVALEEIGFDVKNMDDLHDQVTGKKLEDLRIRVAANPTWTSLAEVKGYTKGVRTNDVPQITQKPCTNFVKETGDEPSTVWFVFNFERGRHPGQRGKPFSVPDLDLEPLSACDGLAVDTRDLFKAWRDVKMGVVDSAVVRQSLIGAVQLWVWPRA